MDVRTLAEQERRDLADLAATLTSEQWDAPSLCEGWRVRDVVAHVVSYEGLSGGQLLRRFAQGRFLPARINAVGIAQHRAATPEELVALLRRHLAPSGLG